MNARDKSDLRSLLTAASSALGPETEEPVALGAALGLLAEAHPHLSDADLRCRIEALLEREVSGKILRAYLGPESAVTGSDIATLREAAGLLRLAQATTLADSVSAIADRLSEWLRGFVPLGGRRG